MEPVEDQIADFPEPVVIPYGPLYTEFDRNFFIPSLIIAFLMATISVVYWQDSIYLPFGDVKARWWVAFVAMFVHADVGHLISNLIFFIPFSTLLAAHYGQITFPFIGILIGYCTHLSVLASSEPGYRLIGASGMVYGLASLWLGLFVLHANRYSFRERLMRAIGVALLLLMPQQFRPEVSYWAHTLGFVWGLIFLPLVARTAVGSWTIYLKQLVWRPEVSFNLFPHSKIEN
jgi:rhomboid protease GluP